MKKVTRFSLGFSLGGLLGICLGTAAAQQATPGTEYGNGRQSFLVRQTPVAGPTVSVTSNRLTLKPGESRAEHRHQGFAVGYVISGKVVFKTEAEAAAELAAGQVFFEPAGALHEQFRNPSDTESAVIQLTFVNPPTR